MSKKIKGVAFIIKGWISEEDYKALKHINGFQGYTMDDYETRTLIAYNNRETIGTVIHKLIELKLDLITIEDITKEGRWIQSEEDPTFYHCSICDNIEMGTGDYCIRCCSKRIKPKTYTIKEGDYVISQSDYNYHICIYKNDKFIFHAQYSKPLNKEELKQYLKDTIKLMKSLSEEDGRDQRRKETKRILSEIHGQKKEEAAEGEEI